MTTPVEKQLSIVIPAYNEEKRIGDTLDAVTAFLATKPYHFDLTIVDDGSTDRTAEIVARRLARVPYVLIRSARNKGKGFAVREGMLHAQGDIICFMDADLSTPIAELDKLLASVRNSYDIAIGSRGLPESRVTIHQNAVRETMGKIFNRIARLLTFKGISDSQCGFKCFKRAVAHDLFSRQQITGFGFDAEILFLAQRLGYRIQEIAVEWHNAPQSRVNILWDPLNMVRDLIRTRFLHGRLKKA